MAHVHVSDNHKGRGAQCRGHAVSKYVEIHETRQSIDTLDVGQSVDRRTSIGHRLRKTFRRSASPTPSAGQHRPRLDTHSSGGHSVFEQIEAVMSDEITNDYRKAVHDMRERVSGSFQLTLTRPR